MFEPGRSYTRPQIHDRVGGDIVSYLPHRYGRVVAACLDQALNPDAPLVILPGSGAQIEECADWLVEQRSAVPTFLKQGPNDWVYVGDYAVVGRSRDAADLAVQQARSGRSRTGRERITSVIQMKAKVT